MLTQLTIKIIQPSTEQQYDEVRYLIRAFVDWHIRRHEGTTLTSDYYGQDEFEQELAYLPAKYGSSRNRLLLAYIDEQPAGCVALRKINK